MKIIKDKQIVADSFTHIADENPVTEGNITVSLKRWQDNKSELNNHTGSLGIRLAPTDKVEDIADHLADIDLVALEFPAFTDGRGFSHARILRNQYAYEGEIRAIGSYMPDQAFYLQRVGVNAFELNSEKELELALSTMDDFSVRYQGSTN